VQAGPFQVVFALQVRASVGVSLSMPGAEILPNERSLALREIAEVNLLGLV
jgi:hypothetical protein